MNTSAKGARAERRARKLLEAAGFTVIRAGASLGLFDLVAFNRVLLLVVQVKVNRGPSPAERARISSFENVPRCARKELWLYRDRKREPEVEVLP